MSSLSSLVKPHIFTPFSPSVAAYLAPQAQRGGHEAYAPLLGCCGGGGGGGGGRRRASGLLLASRCHLWGGLGTGLCFSLAFREWPPPPPRSPAPALPQRRSRRPRPACPPMLRQAREEPAGGGGSAGGRQANNEPPPPRGAPRCTRAPLSLQRGTRAKRPEPERDPRTGAGRGGATTAAGAAGAGGSEASWPSLIF